MDKSFTKLLLQWFDRAGRKNLPWQQNKTPYRVWISEIMLQQTQVATVIPYYERFMQHFPALEDLANAELDAVLHLWAGLGYYSRARNLHRAAKMIMQDYQGYFPDTLEGLLSLPGIGESTAGAILSIAFNQATPILDGNVKRVLARLHAISSPINQKATEEQLWELASHYTPKNRNADYTQAIMDLGATVCTRSKPICASCPVRKLCKALATDVVNQLPQKSSAKKIPVRSATFLVIQHQQTVLLCKRPPTGIWGGLYSLPEITESVDEKLIHRHCRKIAGVTASSLTLLPGFRHTFSHYHLDIQPVLVSVKKKSHKLMDGDNQVWYNLQQPEPIGLPKPVQHILKTIAGIQYEPNNPLRKVKQRS